MTPALALVWSQDEPARVGEVVCLPRVEVPFTIGRATEPGEDGALPLGLARLARFAHRVRVPGLDERREDLPLLARHLLRRLTQSRPQAQPGEQRLSAGLIAALMWHPFAAHAHELIELLWRAIAASPGREVLAPPNAAEPPPPLRSAESYADPQSLTREQVLAALAACDGVREQAWRMLGLRSRDQLKRLLKKLAI